MESLVRESARQSFDRMTELQGDEDEEDEVTIISDTQMPQSRSQDVGTRLFQDSPRGPQLLVPQPAQRNFQAQNSRQSIEPFVASYSFNNNQSTSFNLASSSSSFSTMAWNQGGFGTGVMGNHHPFNFITPDQWNHYLPENSIKCQSFIKPHQFLSLSSSKLSPGTICNHHHHQLQKQQELPQQQKQSFCQPETIVLSTSSPERKETIDERDELLKKKEKNSSLTPEMREKIELKKRKAQEIKAQRIRSALEAERIQNEKKVAAGERCLREFGITSGPTREKPERFNGRAGSSDEIKVAAEEKDFISLEDQRDEHTIFESVRWEGEGDESRKDKPYVTDPRCSEDQLKVLDLAKEGCNVFFTGSAGVGKSFMLQELVRMLKSMGRKVAVTATTGIAALAVNGCTIHSWAKVGLGKGSVSHLYNKSGCNNKNFKRDSRPNIWNTDVLIVDEISMLNPELFEKISILCQAIRRIPRPFGGIQLILSGDFFQLPPVLKEHDFSCMYCGCPRFKRIEESNGGKCERDYESSEGSDSEERKRKRKRVLIKCVKPFNHDWREVPCGRERLEYIFCFETPTWRQSNLIVIQLKKIFRQEEKSLIEVLNKIRHGIVDLSVENMMESLSKPLKDHKIKPTRLYSRNMNVDDLNAREFKLIKEVAYEFKAIDDYGHLSYAPSFKSRLNDIQARPLIKLKVGTQVLLLANIDIAGKLVNGSRGVVIDWKDIPEYYHSNNKNDEEDVLKKKSWSSEQGNKKLPVVLFSCGRHVTIDPHIWKIEIDRDCTITRTQLPLALAWAITIHKSQGQSLDRLCVDLQGVFEYGQAYVALSRARSLEGLEVSGWRRSSVKAHPLVIEFYDSLTSGKPFGQNAPFLNPNDFFPFIIEFIDGNGIHQVTNGYFEELNNAFYFNDNRIDNVFQSKSPPPTDTQSLSPVKRFYDCESGESDKEKDERVKTFQSPLRLNKPIPIIATSGDKDPKTTCNSLGSKYGQASLTKREILNKYTKKIDEALIDLIEDVTNFKFSSSSCKSSNPRVCEDLDDLREESLDKDYMIDYTTLRIEKIFSNNYHKEQPQQQSRMIDIKVDDKQFDRTSISSAFSFSSAINEDQSTEKNFDDSNARSNTRRKKKRQKKKGPKLR